MADIKPAEVSEILKKQLEGFKSSAELSETGSVLQVGDGVARVYGLNNVQANEMIEFQDGTMGIVTFALEHGLLHAKTPGTLKLDTPAGRVQVNYEMTGGKVQWVKIYNVPAYLAHQSICINIPELGELKVDIAFGGNFYIIVEPQGNFKGIEHFSAGQFSNTAH